MAVLGTYILSTHLNPAKLTISTGAFIYALLSMITLVIYTLQPAKLLKEFGSIPVTGVGMLIGGILMCTFMPPANGIGTVDFPAICALFGVIILGTVFSFTMFLEGTKRIGPAKTSLLSAIEPVGSALLCALLMNVKFTIYDVIGMLLIVSTVFISYFSEKE
jgi:drug/metabolite transporter (DMT)-like permease